MDTALSRLRSFPRRVADLTPQALSRLMGRTVDAVSVIDGEAGTSSRARLALTGSGVPESVFVKLQAATAATRMLGELARLGETEARFYSQLAPALGDGVPRSYGSAFDPVTGRYVIVLEDMTTSPCQFPDTLNPLALDQMALLMEVLARLHGTFWGRLPEKPGGGGAFGWLAAPSEDPANLLTPALMRMSAGKLADRTTVSIESGRFLWENYQAATEIVDAGTHTVLHGDSHPGNTYFRDGRAGLLDWQVVRRGHPARDLAYTLVHGLPTADRLAAQRDLLDVYRRALSVLGRPRVRRRRAVAPLPAGGDVCVRVAADHRGSRRHADRGHRHGGARQGGRRHRRSGDGCRTAAGDVTCTSADVLYNFEPKCHGT